MSERAIKRQKTDNESRGRITDPRFVGLEDDPRYRLPSRKQKTKLDKRFAHSFKNDDFVRRAKVDRYGRPIQIDKDIERLRAKFDLESEHESDDPDDDDQVQEELARVAKRDVLREGRDGSDSETESSEEESEEELAEVNEGEAAAEDDVPKGKITSRIAIVNLDWDNIRAEDLMAVFSSFSSSTGRLLKASIYPSQFGKERMEREELEGPPAEIFASEKNADDSEDQEIEDVEDADEQDEDEIKASMIKPDDGTEFDSAALRQYQLERLRYYYAILQFSSPAAAKAVYDLVDGTEYLSTANSFDLRFVPEEMDFDDPPHDECEKLVSGYRPNEFVTDALQHSKVKLTWDTDDISRKEAAARAFKGGQAEIDENDLRAYLGSDTSDGEDDVHVEVVDSTKDETIDTTKKPANKKEQEREKMRAALGLGVSSKPRAKDTPPTGNIQVTFTSGLTDTQPRSVFENSPEPEETTMEKYIRKEKERKTRRKEKTKSGKTDMDTTQAEPDKATDLGFEDPFFVDSVAANDEVKSKARKADRARKRAEREADEAASANQRRHLELLMADESEDTSSRVVRHFDMTEIERAEKMARKGKKKLFGRNRERDIDQSKLQDGFEVETGDPRLARLFESHEMAIDPTRGRVRMTKGTERILEEARQRKQRRDERRDTAREKRAKKEKSEVADLVDRLKKRAP